MDRGYDDVGFETGFRHSPNTETQIVLLWEVGSGHQAARSAKRKGKAEPVLQRQRARSVYFPCQGSADGGETRCLSGAGVWDYRTSHDAGHQQGHIR